MNSAEYEVFVGNLLKLFSANTAISPPGISHLRRLTGKSGQVYEIDLSYSFRVAEADYLTLVECKQWNKPVGRDIVSAFRSVIEDIGAHKGIICTTVGFQEGALGLAATCGIGLFKATETQFEPVKRITGPEKDVRQFLLEAAPAYAGGAFGAATGTITVPQSTILDYVGLRYGEEVASFLSVDEARSLDQVKESPFKEKLEQQILAMGQNWIREYLTIETCGMPVVVEPQFYFRALNMKIYANYLALRKARGEPLD